MLLHGISPGCSMTSASWLQIMADQPKAAQKPWRAYELCLRHSLALLGSELQHSPTLDGGETPPNPPHAYITQCLIPIYYHNPLVNFGPEGPSKHFHVLVYINAILQLTLDLKAQSKHFHIFVCIYTILWLTLDLKAQSQHAGVCMYSSNQCFVYIYTTFIFSYFQIIPLKSVDFFYNLPSSTLHNYYKFTNQKSNYNLFR